MKKTALLGHKPTGVYDKTSLCTHKYDTKQALCRLHGMLMHRDPHHAAMCYIAAWQATSVTQLYGTGNALQHRNQVM